LAGRIQEDFQAVQILPPGEAGGGNSKEVGTLLRHEKTPRERPQLATIVTGCSFRSHNSTKPEKLFMTHSITAGSLG
jgi:hypothetical protein